MQGECKLCTALGDWEVLIPYVTAKMLGSKSTWTSSVDLFIVAAVEMFLAVEFRLRLYYTKLRYV